MSVLDFLVNESVNSAGVAASQSAGVLTQYPEVTVLVVYAIFWLIPASLAAMGAISLGRNLPLYFTKFIGASLLMGVPGFVLLAITSVMHVCAFISVLYWWLPFFQDISLFEMVTSALYNPWGSIAMTFPVLEIVPVSTLLSALVVQCSAHSVASTYNVVIDKAKREREAELLEKFEVREEPKVSDGQRITGGPVVLKVATKQHVLKKSKK